MLKVIRIVVTDAYHKMQGTEVEDAVGSGQDEVLRDDRTAARQHPWWLLSS